MSNTSTIAVLIGSLRKESLSRRIAKAAVALAPQGTLFDFPDIGGLPHYNADLETATPPPEWQALREQIKAATGVLFVTPEYNRSVPGVLKNAIDVGSRPAGKSIWNGKPCAVISVSPGALGAFGANHHIRASFVSLNMPVMQQPEAYIGNAAGLFDANGALANDATREFLSKYMQAFSQWVARHA